MKRYVVKYLKTSGIKRGKTPQARRLQSRTAMRLWHKNILARPSGQAWLESAPKHTEQL